MKVAQLLYSGLGGHGSVAFSLIAGDREHRWSNAMCFIGIEPLLPAYAERCEQLGIKPQVIRTRPGRPWDAWRPVYQWLKQERPKALLVHSTTVLLPCLLYGRLHKVPVLLVEHQSVDLKRRRDWLLSALGMLFAQKVILLSKSAADGFLHRLNWLYRASRVTVIVNGIDTTLFAPAPLRMREPFRIGMAARFIQSKRLGLLVEALTRLQSQVPERSWQLSFAGDGPEKETIKRRVPALAQGSVSFEGVLDEQQLADWYRSLSVYALATDGETFNTSTLQAMSSGLPILASDVTGLKDQVTADFGVLLPNDPQAWADALKNLSAEPDRASVMGANARRHCLASYSAEDMHNAYDRLISDTLAAASQPATTSS